MALYRVHVRSERTVTFYVEAASYKAASTDAVVLAAELGIDDFDEDHRELDLEEETGVPDAGRWIWTGGEAGEAVPTHVYRARN